MQIYVTPRRDATGDPFRVPDIEEGFRRPLPPEGKWVADAAYWRRRARDCEVDISAAGPSPTTQRPAKRRAKNLEPAAEPVANATPSEE